MASDTQGEENSVVMDGINETPKVPVINTILAHVSIALDSSTSASVHKLISATYCLEEIIEAKKLLWANSSLGEYKNRKSSNTRTEKDANIKDVIDGLKELDDKGDTPCICLEAKQVRHLPKCEAEECMPFSIVERLEKLERKMIDNQIQIDKNIVETMSIGDRVKRFEEGKTFTWASMATPKPAPINSNIIPRDNRIFNLPKLQPNRGNAEVANVLRGKSEINTDRLDIDDTDNSEDDDFEIPAAHRKKERRQQSRNQRKIITGNSRSETSFTGAPPPKRSVFVYRVDKGTTERSISEYLNERSFEGVDVKLRSNPDATFKSFVVSISMERLDEMLKPELWPEGVRVRKYFQKQRTNESGGSFSVNRDNE